MRVNNWEGVLDMGKKKLLIILCAVLVCVVTAVTILLFSNKYEAPFWVRQEIEENWEAVTGTPFERWLDPTPGSDGGMRYYGMYNGYYILFDGMGLRLDHYTAIYIGNEIIADGSGFGIYAYKDGVFTNLKDAYDMGLLSDRQIAKIAETHRKADKEIHPWNYTESNS